MVDLHYISFPFASSCPVFILSRLSSFSILGHTHQLRSIATVVPSSEPFHIGGHRQCLFQTAYAFQSISTQQLPLLNLRDPAYHLRRTPFTRKCLPTYFNLYSPNRRSRQPCWTTISGEARVQCPPFNFTLPDCGAKPYKRSPLLSTQPCLSPMAARHISIPSCSMTNVYCLTFAAHVRLRSNKPPVDYLRWNKRPQCAK